MILLLYKNMIFSFRIKSWKTDTTLDHKEAELLNSNLCSSCGHNGKIQKHAKSGCIDCGTVVKCNNSYRYILIYNINLLFVLLLFYFCFTFY